MSALCSEDRMDTAAQWLCPQEIELDLDVPNRWEALRAVSAMVERSHSAPAAPVFRALWRREQAGSTGMGNAFAIPHARITGISEPVTVYVRMKTPLAFAAPDGKRVSDLFVILVPADGANACALAHSGAGGGSVFRPEISARRLARRPTRRTSGGHSCSGLTHGNVSRR